MRDLREFVERCKAMPPLQRSRFLDGPRYQNWTIVDKAAADRRERRTIRAGGVVGTPGCNVFAVIEPGPEAETVVQFIVDAREAIPELYDQLLADDRLFLELDGAECCVLDDVWWALRARCIEARARKVEKDE